MRYIFNFSNVKAYFLNTGKDKTAGMANVLRYIEESLLHTLTLKRNILTNELPKSIIWHQSTVLCALVQ